MFRMFNLLESKQRNYLEDCLVFEGLDMMRQVEMKLGNTDREKFYSSRKKEFVKEFQVGEYDSRVEYLGFYTPKLAEFN